MELLQWWSIPDYQSFTADQWILYICFATLGWVIRLSLSNREIVFPRYANGRIILNGVGEWLTAVVIGTLANHNILIVTCAALGGSVIARQILEIVSVMFKGFSSVHNKQDDNGP